MKREAYRSVDVKQVSIESLVAEKTALPAVVGIDVAKSESLAVTRWQSGDFERPWRVKTPEEVSVLVDRLRDLGTDAEKRLKSWGGSQLKSEKIERFVQAAARSVGVRQTAVDCRRVQECAEAAIRAKREVQKASATLESLAPSNAIIARQAAVVGWATACVLWSISAIRGTTIVPTRIPGRSRGVPAQRVGRACFRFSGQ